MQHKVNTDNHEAPTKKPLPLKELKAFPHGQKYFFCCNINMLQSHLMVANFGALTTSAIEIYFTCNLIWR